MENYGYAGNILCVDLTTGDVKIEPLEPRLTRDFIGGIGINCRLAFDLIKPSVDPLSPQSPIIIGVGPLCGTLAHGASKCVATMKFPLSAVKGGEKYQVATASSGSRWFGPMLKYAGYDHLVITGKAPRPSYLKVIDDDIEICDASDLWGKDVYSTTDELVRRHRGTCGGCGVWTIGKAGENLVRWAHGVVDKRGSMGRYGGGAVLGSKNLKAIVTLGSKGIRVADPKRFEAMEDRRRRGITSHPLFGGPHPHDLAGVISNEYPADLAKRLRVARIACITCLSPEFCLYEVKDGRFTGETMQATTFRITRDFGRRLRLADYGEMIKLMDLINRNGLDMLTSLKMIYFVTRLYERGVISAKDTGGLVLKVGNFDCYAALLEKIINRQNIGDAMAGGWYPLSERVGVDASDDFRDGAEISKGCDHITETRFWNMDPDTFEHVVRPRGHKLIWLTQWRGPDPYQDTYWPHGDFRSLYDIRRAFEGTSATKEEMERMFTERHFNLGRCVRHGEDAQMVFDAMGFCVYSPYGLTDAPDEIKRTMSRMSDYYSAVTGVEVSPRELKTKGERILNLERLLNVREGFSREDDQFPSVVIQNIKTPIRLRGMPSRSLPAGDHYLENWFGERLTEQDLSRMLDDYYDERGWDIGTGVPTREKLQELELSQFTSTVAKYLTK